MTSIFVLTSGEYTDVMIEGVYSTMEIAEEQKKLLQRRCSVVEIDEYELDEPV